VTVSIVSRPQSYCGMSAEVQNTARLLRTIGKRICRREKYTIKVNKIFRENFEKISKELKKNNDDHGLVILNLNFANEREKSDQRNPIEE
jgi:hypothetical protein